MNGSDVMYLPEFDVEWPDEFEVNRWQGYLVATWNHREGQDDRALIRRVRDEMHELEIKGIVELHGARYHPAGRTQVYSAWFEFTPYGQALIAVIAYEESRQR